LRAPHVRAFADRTSLGTFRNLVKPYRIGFILENTLGNATFAMHLREWAGRDPEIDPVFASVDSFADDVWQKIPGVRRNWTVLGSLRARGALRELEAGGECEALYVHTQLLALFLRRQMHRTPTVLSLDATPINMDQLDPGYGATKRVAAFERVKNAINARTYRVAGRLIGFSRWVGDSLQRDYRLPPQQVEVIPPGVDLDIWQPPAAATARRSPASEAKTIRLLFVGGQFQRKGGPMLLRALLALRQQVPQVGWELDIATGDNVDDLPPGVRVHRGLAAQSQQLVELFQNADVFVLPTLGDTFGLVLVEAMACGVPVVATRVGALPEVVGEPDAPDAAGLLVAPGDDAALTAALRELGTNDKLRQQLATSARARAERHFDGRRNFQRLLDRLKDLAETRRRTRGGYTTDPARLAQSV
jgi:glycosyltransferase involved in cell wall biosynthesis